LLDTRLSVLPALDTVLRAFAPFPRIKAWLLQAGFHLKVDLFVLILLGAAGLSAFTAAAFGVGGWGRLAAAAVGLLAPVLLVAYARRRRRQAFQMQLPFALDALARAMQAGHSFSVALRMVGRDLEEPIAGELRLTAEEISFGATVRLGMERLADRVNTPDIRFFVAAVLIHMQTGGRLSDLLFNLAALVRDRQKLVDTIRVLSAEGRLAAWIFTALPVATGSVLYALNPSFISVLWTNPQGIFLIKVMVVMAVFGLLWMAWLTRAEV
jgi:tight adherence protein B